MRLGRDFCFKAAYDHLKAGRDVTFYVAVVNRKTGMRYESILPQLASYHTKTSIGSLRYHITQWMGSWEKLRGPIVSKGWYVADKYGRKVR